MVSFDRSRALVAPDQSQSQQSEGESTLSGTDSKIFKMHGPLAQKASSKALSSSFSANSVFPKASAGV
jgi:hypothetical protein